ncbi:hypothetical protein [Dendronalium sp. ChiSLP03b]
MDATSSTWENLRPEWFGFASLAMQEHHPFALIPFPKNNDTDPNPET